MHEYCILLSIITVLIDKKCEGLSHAHICMVAHIKRWEIRDNARMQQGGYDGNEFALKSGCEDVKDQRGSGFMWVGCIRNYMASLTQLKYRPRQINAMLSSEYLLSQDNFSKSSNIPQATIFLLTSFSTFLRLAADQSAPDPPHFRINAQGRNINYYQYQFRHMNTDESISLSTSQNISKIDRNHFLIRGDANAYYKEEVIIDFEPVKAIDPFLSPPRLSSFSIIPTFNQDSKYYTLAFINPFDVDQEEEDDKIRTQHETRVKECSTQIAEKDILMPKPRHPDPFCGVCREAFSDYLEHINSSKHENKVKKSRFSRFIVEMGEDLFPKVRKSRRIISKGRK